MPNLIGQSNNPYAGAQPIQPVGSGLLGAIATPYVPDVPGAILAGRASALQLKQMQLKNEADQQAMQQSAQSAPLVQEHLGAQTQQLQGANREQEVKQFFYDGVAAYAVGGEKRNALIQRFAQDYEQKGSEFAGKWSELLQDDEQTQDAKFEQMLKAGQQMGVFPAPQQQEFKMTSDMQNALSMGLQPGSPEYNDYIKNATVKQGNNVNVNVKNEGPIPEGYDRDPETRNLKPIPGGPVDLKQKDDIDKLAMAMVVGKEKFTSINQNISDAFANIGFWTTGVPGTMSKYAAGTHGYDLNQTMSTIKANLSFDKLQEMRDMSPTGGALGQVSEIELALLERARGSLEQAQTREQLKKNLQRIQEHYANWHENVQRHAQLQAKRRGVSDEEFGSLSKSLENTGKNKLKFDEQGNPIQ